VVLICDDSLRDLQAFRRRSNFHAGRGGHGQGALRHGADGETIEVPVPPGTEIIGPDEGDLEGRRWELLADGQSATVARGGTGGKGNKRFATPTRQAPRFAERGLPGEEGWLELRLKLLADVGLVGLPNAGKSSLLSRLTRAAPKIADYPFTTLSPVLGVLEGEERQLVIADIPGLIEGASGGAGLGHEFLAHVERTRLLVHVLELAPELSNGTGAGAPENHATVERELLAHDERLAGLPRLLALSKADLLPEEEVRRAVSEWKARLGPDVPVIATSSATGQGLGELAEELLRRPEFADRSSERGAYRPPGTPVEDGDAGELEPGAFDGGRATAGPGSARGQAPAEMAEHMVFRPAGPTGFHVERLGPRSFAVRGRGIELLVRRYDVENEDAMSYLEGRLRRIGVIRALEAEGFTPGDEIEIAGTTFELDPSED
jgi:GTP-binding protein